MKKRNVSAVVILLVVAAIYNVIVFVAPFTQHANFWWAYGATMFALAFQVFSALFAFGKANTLKSKFLGISVFRVGYIYLTLQLIFGFVFMIVPFKTWATIIAYVVLLGITLINMMEAEIGRDIVTDVDHKTAVKVFYIKSIQADLEALVAKTDNALVKQDLKQLVSAVKYSDPMSNESLYPLEEKIKEQVAELCEAIELREDSTAKSLILEIGKLVVERNQKCKLLK